MSALLSPHNTKFTSQIDLSRVCLGAFTNSWGKYIFKQRLGLIDIDQINNSISKLRLLIITSLQLEYSSICEDYRSRTTAQVTSSTTHVSR
jgi:hypothetical protein